MSTAPLTRLPVAEGRGARGAVRAVVAGRLHTRVIRISEFIQPEGETEQKLYAPASGRSPSTRPREDHRVPT
jgi:hypothetical protein